MNLFFMMTTAMNVDESVDSFVSVEVSWAYNAPGSKVLSVESSHQLIIGSQLQVPKLLGRQLALWHAHWTRKRLWIHSTCERVLSLRVHLWVRQIRHFNLGHCGPPADQQN